MLVSCTAFSACECEFSVVIEIIHFAGASLRRFIFIYICCVLLIFVLSVNGPKLPKIVSLHAALGFKLFASIPHLTRDMSLTNLDFLEIIINFI